MHPLLRKLAAPLIELGRLYRWPLTPPYSSTNEPRKPVAEMRKDLRRWKAKFGSYGYDYFKYGADIVGEDVEDYVPYYLFREYRNLTNATLVGPDDFNYVCVLEDKLLFARLAKAFGHPTPALYAVLDPDRFEIVADRSIHAPADFLEAFPNIKGILKPALGTQGADIFILESRDGALRLDGQEITTDDLFGQVKTKYIFQELIQQHPDLARIHPSSVNTLRLITIRQNDRAVPLSAGVRAGIGGTHLDNWSQGGMMAPVDLERGIIAGRGLFGKGQPTVERHPDTGVTLPGYALPFIPECIDVACAFHNDLYGFHSVGWDLAVTETGPTILEGNARWGSQMAVSPGFARRYFATFESIPPTPYRHRTARVVTP